MGLQVCVKRHLGLELVLAMVLASASAMPLSAAASPADTDMETFAAQARGEGRLAISQDDGAAQWSTPEPVATSLASYAEIELYRPAGDPSAAHQFGGESFSTYARAHHGGGGRGQRGEFGDEPGGGCEDRCVGATAVPEPALGSLMAAGAVALLIFVKRRRSGAGRAPAP